MREVSQRGWDRQERLLEAEGRAAAKYRADMRELKRLLAEYPDQAHKLLLGKSRALNIIPTIT